MTRRRLRNRRGSETFTLELHGLRYVASFSRSPMAGSKCSGAPLLRDAHGDASTPLGIALDVIAEIEGQRK
jgi:hypothetical protein